MSDLAVHSWERVPLSHVTDKIGSGATPKGGRNSYKSAGVSLIRSLNVHDLEFRYENLAYIDEVQASALANVELKPGDVLLNITGASIARCAVVPVDVLPARVNQHVSILRPRKELLDSDFLAYLLVSGGTKDELLGIGNKAGATRQALTKAQLEAFRVPLPPMDEQKRIVSTLDQAFAALDRARAHAEANLEDADVLHSSTLDELIRQQRSSWNAGTVSSLVGQVSTGPFGSLLHKRDYIDGGVPIVNPSNIVGGVITPDWSKTVSADAAERLNSYRLRVGDLVIGRRGEMGRCAPVLPEMEGWLCGTGSFIIRPKSDVSPEFVSYLMRSPMIVDRLSAIATGATMPNLSNRALAQMPFELPAYEMQIVMLEQMKALETKTGALRSAFAAKLTDIAALRQSLLQQAFSGQLT